MNRILLTLAAMCLVAVCTMTFSGCKEEGPMEKAGEKVDEAAEDLGEAVEEATEDLDDKN